jgi:hypothetical protein
MRNKDYSELAKDFKYIKSKYKELLDIEPLENPKKSHIYKVIDKFT